MKRIVLIAVAAVFAWVSCQKYDVPAVDPVFEASIITTKTAIDALTGIVSWELNDEVTITDASSTQVVYVASEVNGSSATLTKKTGETGTLGAGPYTAIYGNDPSAQQAYGTSVPSLPMSAESNDNTFSFTVTCGLLELSVTQPGESLKRISVSNGTDTYTLECNPSVSVATQNLFYIALPADNYSSFTFINADDQVCRFNLKEGKSFSVSANKIHPLTFNSNIVFKDEPLGGVFSVGENTRVRFSRGNLQYQASSGKWRFAANQYDFIGDNAGNTTESGRDTQTDWIDLFGWGATGQNAFGVAPYSSSKTTADFKTQESTAADEVLTLLNKGDWGVCKGDGWRTLSSAEWTFLLGNNSLRSQNQRQISTVTFAPGVSVYGLIIMPDGWSRPRINYWSLTTDQDQWAELEAAGAVFLPVTGLREGAEVKYLDNGYYWTTTAVSTTNANDLFLKASEGAAKMANIAAGAVWLSVS